jgi:nitroimidazol reductase NimA-like FMN-containing flavoprotein (pyridoxamine 5'-phosphate oxidase superfamily)
MGLTDGPLLTGAEAEFVAARRVAHLATTYPDGLPHVVPISTVLDLDRVVFATERATQKVANLRSSPFVSICFDEYLEDWTQLRQVLVHGRAILLDAGLEWRRDRQLLYDAFPQYEREAPIEEATTLMVEVRIDRVATWGF